MLICRLIASSHSLWKFCRACDDGGQVAILTNKSVNFYVYFMWTNMSSDVAIVAQQEQILYVVAMPTLLFVLELMGGMLGGMKHICKDEVDT